MGNIAFELFVIDGLAVDINLECVAPNTFMGSFISIDKYQFASQSVIESFIFKTSATDSFHLLCFDAYFILRF